MAGELLREGAGAGEKAGEGGDEPRARARVRTSRARACVPRVGWGLGVGRVRGWAWARGQREAAAVWLAEGRVCLRTCARTRAARAPSPALHDAHCCAGAAVSVSRRGDACAHSLRGVLEARGDG